MSPRVRHEQDKEQMKQLILEAAINITAEIGYEKLSMRKIADVIDYTPTTIYLYYKDKKQIVADIVMIIYQEVILNIQKVFYENDHLPLEVQLKLAFETFIETIISKPEMGKVIISSGAKTMFNSDEGGEDHGTGLLQQFLNRGQQQGVFRQLDENIAWMVITALIGFSTHALENKTYLQENWQQLTHLYTEMLVNGLLAQKEQSLDIDAILEAVKSALTGD